jgi:hypothetical protein
MSPRAVKQAGERSGARSRAAAASVVPGGRALKLVPADPAAQLAEAIDELGALEAEMILIRPKLTRIETLRALIRERFDDKPKEKTFEARGAHYTATLGPCAYQRSLDSQALVKAIGLKAYAAIARPTLKDVVAAVAPHIAAKCITQDYTGARPLRTFPIGNGAE